ncbi:hypothetical protein K2173_012403 [Erythroxylum novogranatense]|uniref:Uncharacterized protein n=1 Tax=Erythroxylum novogranatense TaxID=1862640 RepID=A0AAV8UDD5_9ROSI|nr:hypothetical protein K2173_012403 [Erythroxylum novogranatense]
MLASYRNFVLILLLWIFGAISYLGIIVPSLLVSAVTWWSKWRENRAKGGTGGDQSMPSTRRYHPLLL